MKHSKLLLLLASFTAVSGLAGCGDTSSSTTTPSQPGTSEVAPETTDKPSSNDNTSSTDKPSSNDSSSSDDSSSSTEENKNTFGEGITEDQKVILAKLAEGAFTKAEFTATDKLLSKFLVKEGETLKVIIYEVKATTNFLPNGFSVYVGVDKETYKITGIQTVGNSTTHGQDSKFENVDLGMTGTDGSTFDSVTGSTVTSTAINEAAKAAVKAVKDEFETPVVPPVPEKESYTITFDLNGGTGAFAATKVEANEVFARPATDPVKTDYNFIGWFIKDTDTKYDFTKPVTEDITLVARYQSAYTFYKGEILKAPKVGKDGKVVIPSEIDGETVTTLTDHLFAGNTELKEIVIPETVKEIKFNAFEGCTSLTKFAVKSTLDENGKIAKDLEFGINVFDGCKSLTEFNVPARTITLGTSSFANCTGLKKVNFTTVINLSNDLFAGCTSLQEVNLAKIENEYCDLGQRAFEGCTSLTTIKNSETIKKLGTDSLNGCTSLKKIAFGKAFQFEVNGLNGTKLDEITIDPANEKYACVNKIFYQVKNGQADRLMYCYDSDLTTLEIPASVTSYDYNAFKNLTSLKTITVAEGNKKYTAKNGVLFEGTLLKFIPHAFVGDIELTDDEKFTTSSVVFAGVKGLKDIKVSPTNKTFDLVDGVLYSKDYSKKIVYVNKSKTGVVKTNVQKIGEYALAYHNGITDLVLTYTGYSPVSLEKNALLDVNPELKVWVPAGKYSSYTTGYSSWDKAYQHFVQKEAYVEPAAPQD